MLSGTNLCGPLHKTLCLHSGSLHPGIQMGMVNLMLRDSTAMDKHSIQGEYKRLLAASCYRNRDKLRPDGPFSLYADFTFTLCGSY